MGRILSTLGGLALLVPLAPPLALGSEVRVDVRVSADPRGDSYAWVEFRPDRPAYVALYAVFSDGSLRPIFPSPGCPTHWVDPWRFREVEILLPPGAELVSVEAIASPNWFDPTLCWMAACPGGSALWALSPAAVVVAPFPLVRSTPPGGLPAPARARGVECFPFVALGVTGGDRHSFCSWKPGRFGAWARPASTRWAGGDPRGKGAPPVAKPSMRLRVSGEPRPHSGR